MKHKDPIERSVEAFAALNPFPFAQLPELESAPERGHTFALIRARRNAPVARTHLRPRLAAVAAIGLVTALAIPAFAFSRQLNSLFGFSNEGTSVDKSGLDLRTASALDTAGVNGGVKLLASRPGVRIYVAHGEGRKLCFFVGSPNGPDGRGVSGGCRNAAASANFPSPAQPVVDMSAFFYEPRALGEGITRLAGVAADGVARIEVLGLDCEIIAEAPAVDNVYARSALPDIPAVAIVGLSADGRQVYLNKLRFWDRSACATRGAN